MTLTLSDDQLRDVKRGSPVSVRSPEFEGPVVLCRQAEFAQIVLAVVTEIRDKAGDRLTDEELRDEVEEALFRKAWARAGRKALAARSHDDAAGEP